VAERATPFGKYFLLERINVGGMAEVYKAKTVGVEGFEKIVAIKRILPSVAADEQFIKMFVDEAKITSQLSHANLAQTFDLGKIDDAYYIAMEYVPGKDLRSVFERLKRRGERMPLPLAAWVMGRVCEGLDYAHRKRDASGRELHIVHRDVSPQNIILSYEGEVKLIDFGIAKAANKITKTQAGILKGKFGYMSPEQVRGLPLDRRSDIFAAGVVLYELCTGERLFTGSSDFSVLEKVQQARVKPPSQVEASIPLKLERIVLKALAREPEDRYQQAADVAAELTRFLLEGQPRPVTRDDLSAFMKATFPEDERREAEAPLRRPPPRIDEPQRKPPPRVEEERTLTGPVPLDQPRAEIIVKSKMGPPSSPDLVQPGDSPTRPMSMNELAAAEREYAQRPSAPAKRAPPPRSGPPPRRAPPPLPMTLLEMPEKVPIEDQKTELRPAPAEPPLYGERMEVSTDSTLRRRARFIRGAQIGIIGVALSIAAWALLSTPRPYGQSEQPVPVTVSRAEQNTVRIAAEASTSSIVVLSSPPGAQVYLDGERKGTTPAYLMTLDPATPHAISVEKKCYRSWQVAVPPHAGPRELAATLLPASGACPGSHLEKTGMPAPSGLPDDAAATATLGFLNLGSRPSAQVQIDGVDIGQSTPLLAWPLTNGTHKVRLLGNGGSKEVTVQIRTGESNSAIVDLSRPPPAKAVKKRRARR
jgi:serine/threonine protein kinase